MSLLVNDRHNPSRPRTDLLPPSRASALTQTTMALLIVATSLAASSPFTARAEPALTRVAEANEPWSSLIVEAAERFAIPPAWIRAVMRVESRGNANAVSSRGAVGLMQIMPETYAELRVRYALGADPADPHDNILAGAAYLREMHERFGAAGFLAAYNAGPARYEDHLATGHPLPDETRSYVAALTALLSGMPSPEASEYVVRSVQWRNASLFVARSERKSTDALLSLTPQSPRTESDRKIADLAALTPLPDGLFISARKDRPKP